MPLAGVTPPFSLDQRLALTSAGPFPCQMEELETCLSRPVPAGGPAGAGRPCNGFAVLHAVAAVLVHERTIGP